MMYPARLFRGLRKQDWLIDGPGGTKRVSQEAFAHDDSTSQGRDDNCCETSINWDDDANALDFTAKQPNSQYGVVSIATESLIALEESAEVAKQLSHERRPVNGNPYHGNLLFVATCPKKFLRLIHTALALRAGEPVAPPRR